MQISKPVNRGAIRKILGKEYFCLKQNAKWRFGSEKFANSLNLEKLPVLVKNHSSLLLRKLKNVDMYLQHNKIVNLNLAITNMDGIIIQPGETFSLWKLVGRPTKSKGYLEGMTLSNGYVTSGIGGGLCQLGNLIYWMIIHTPLTITKRWRHSFDVFPDVNRKIPFGSGATLSYNYIDLQIKNNTKQPYQINLSLSNTHLLGNISTNQELSHQYEVFEKNHKIELQYWGGYTRHNEIWRRLTDVNSGAESEELVTENHAIMMYNPLIE